MIIIADSCLMAWGFLGDPSSKDPNCQYRRHKRFNLWVGKIPGEGNGNPLQYSCQENPTDRGAWRAMVHRNTKSQTQLKHLSLHASWLSWVNNPPAVQETDAGDGCSNPWVRKILWRRKWQPTPTFLPGKFHEQRSLVGCKEPDTTE